jgi:outer membrane receptor protein involved in Fe transport
LIYPIKFVFFPLNLIFINKYLVSQKMRQLYSIVFFSTFCLIFFLPFLEVFAQETQVSGKISDAKSGEILAGVNISVKDKLIGTISDSKGNFNLTVKSPPPFTLIISMVGYTSQSLEITQNQAVIDIKMSEEVFLGREVVVAASRVEERIMESSVSVEKLDLLDIQAIPAANFYDGLSRIKGVDMSVQSLTFANPNTRGFNGNTNYRINQIIDGVENIVPGLSFAPGNIVGIPPLDVESVELLVGASSALYGPGGMNGTLLMNSKNPFEYQGLSASLQTGLMHTGADYRSQPAGMYDFNARFAKAYKNKWAFKMNIGYISALDWHATDYRDRNDLSSTANSSYLNPAYDGVNVYGDEAVGQVNIGTSGPIARQVADGYARGRGNLPGSVAYTQDSTFLMNLFPQRQIVNRTGYREIDLANYNTESLKLNGSLNYRINDRLEMILQGNYGQGTSLYTANNRFSLINFKFYTGKLELKGTHFFLRAWTTAEDAGDSFDMGGLALRFNEAWRSSADWYQDYIQGFTTARILGNDLGFSYRFARGLADNRTEEGNVIDPARGFRRPLPGDSEFENLYNQIRKTPINEGGAKVIDKTRMHHFEGMYNFSNFFKFAEVLAGASLRIYRINSEGTIFGDAPGNPINVLQIGAYIQITKKMLDDRLKLIGSARYDRNENFEGRLTPRGSLVYTLDKKKNHFLRASLQTAFRFPSTSDQFTDLSAGGVYQVIGGLPRFRQKYNLEETPVYPMNSPNPVTAIADFSQGPFRFPQMRPETVIAYELGYKGLIKSNLLLDAYVYYNTYNGFLATQGLVQSPNQDGTGGNKYTMVISTDRPINALGWAISGDYKFKKGYNVGLNISYNSLAYNELPSGFQTNFNSPNYRSNVYVANRNVFKSWGFSLNWRWQNSFIWESTFGVGKIPAFHTLDAQITYRVPKVKTLFKLGGSNLLNQYYTTGFGNPQIGALYYFAVTFEEFLK